MGGGDMFDPASFIVKYLVAGLDKYRNNTIAQAILSHPHTDHIAQCGRLSKQELLYPTLLTCPSDHKKSASHEQIDWKRLGKEDPEKEELIRTYKGLYEQRTPPVQTILYDSARTIPNLEYGLYYIDPEICDALHPTNDNQYGNALSIVFFLRHGDHTILFPGDMTPEGMSYLLANGDGVQKRFSRFERRFEQQHPGWHMETGSQPSLKELLEQRGLSVLVAPHHGLESCYSEDLFAVMRNGKPRLNVLSERRKAHDGDRTTDARYQSANGASGVSVNVDGKVEPRRSVSTKDGHHILITFSGSGAPGVYLRKKSDQLVTLAS